MNDARKWLARTIVSVTLMGTGLTANAQQNLLAPANSVSFTISVVQKPLGESITVAYDIVNVGKSPLYVPRGWEATACLDIGGPRISAHFAQRMSSGYGASCSGTPAAALPPLDDRMRKGTVWLLPSEHYGGVLQLPTNEIVTGPNTIIAVLRGWRLEDFTAAQWADLAAMGSPLLAGELQASTSITLTP